MEKMVIRSVRNAHGCKVKRCCASCQHKCIESDGTRICAQMMLKVEQRFNKNAGKSGGVVRLKGTQDVIIH